MNNLVYMGKWLFAAAIAAFGIQHFIYVDYVASLIPAWIPWHLFFACLTGCVFIVAALSIIINVYMRQACMLLAFMLTLFLLLVNIPKLSAHPQDIFSWTRSLQDIVIISTALILTGTLRLRRICKYLFAVPVIILGLQHFVHIAFVIAKVPPYFPAVAIWDYLVGVFIVAAACGIISNRYLSVPGLMLGIFLLAFALLYHVPILIADVYYGREWSGFMLDIIIAGGAFAVAGIAQKPGAVKWQHNKADAFIS